MLTNFHTHSTFCDGKSTAEEVVLTAIEKGFSAIGFSGHAYTDFDLSYCMKDISAYKAEILRLKDKYKDKIQIYLGTEEDMFQPVNRNEYDYIIGSSHYSLRNGIYYPIDSSYDTSKECISAWDNNPLAFAENYFKSFCDYILSRKPDIIGHFDLITKFDERNEPLLMNSKQYNEIAEKYITQAIKSECIFEVNTGAISRGYRTTPYPAINLLHILRKNGAEIILSADSHSAQAIDCAFEETKLMLKDIGFEYLRTLYNGEFVKDYL
ncbi:MAG: histidinol-phosphatase [Clostridia bacterium]|nr:histidinol-phosphatase [Clostridia bacterium]